MRWVREQVTVCINNGEPRVGSFQLKRPMDVEASNLPRPNPRWEMVDSNGHYHAYSTEPPEYPTLDTRPEHVECDGSCGGVCEGEGYSVTKYLCRICHEEIKPGLLQGPHFIQIEGLWEWELAVDGYTPTGSFDETVSVCIDQGNVRRWGVALVTGIQVSDGECRVELVGAGPLGRRSAAINGLTDTEREADLQAALARGE